MGRRLEQRFLVTVAGINRPLRHVQRDGNAFDRGLLETALKEHIQCFFKQFRLTQRRFLPRWAAQTTRCVGGRLSLFHVGPFQNLLAFPSELALTIRISVIN